MKLKIQASDVKCRWLLNCPTESHPTSLPFMQMVTLVIYKEVSPILFEYHCLHSDQGFRDQRGYQKKGRETRLHLDFPGFTNSDTILTVRYLTGYQVP